MGRLAGFRYRKIVKKLKTFGFVFDRQAAGGHEMQLYRLAKHSDRAKLKEVVFLVEQQ